MSHLTRSKTLDVKTKTELIWDQEAASSNPGGTNSQPVTELARKADAECTRKDETPFGTLDWERDARTRARDRQDSFSFCTRSEAPHEPVWRGPRGLSAAASKRLRRNINVVKLIEENIEPRLVRVLRVAR